MADLLDIGKDFKVLAIEKIDKELKEFYGDRYGKAVHTYVANALRDFCAKSDRFAEVLYKTRRSMSDCVKEIMKGCGQHISDIEVYRRAARFYFPNSEVDFVMTITISGDALEIGFNSRFLLDALKAAETDRVLMQFVGASGPATITPLQGDSFLSLILPVRLKAE